VNSPGATLIDLCTKNRLGLVELLDVLDRAENDVGHLVGCETANPWEAPSISTTSRA
jgi:hypothetical protein